MNARQTADEAALGILTDMLTSDDPDVVAVMIGAAAFMGETQSI